MVHVQIHMILFITIERPASKHVNVLRGTPRSPDLIPVNVSFEGDVMWTTKSSKNWRRFNTLKEEYPKLQLKLHKLCYILKNN
jgi:hypothetical protein